MEKNVFETAKAFRALNEMAMKDQVAIFGSDYLCDFPFYDLMQGRVTDYVIYNRSIKGLTVKDAAAVAEDALKHLAPRIVLVSFGENEVMDDKFFENYSLLMKKLASLFLRSKICLLQKMHEDKEVVEKLKKVAESGHAEFIATDEFVDEKTVFGRLSGFFRGGKMSFADAFSNI